MKRLSLISFLICLCANYIFAQFSTYSPNDNAYNVVFDVEDLSSDEIKFYNLLKSHNYSEDNSMYIVNVARAQNNLMLAPATIIEMTYAIDKKNEDNLGSNELFLNIINTTPKTIKEITLKFSFYNGGKQVYDIKTGDPYCILTFRNLKGRVDSEDTNRILSSILDCFHSLKTSDAVNVKKFFNKKANSCKIESVIIKYTDGTSSTKAALFDNGPFKQYDLYNDGPLAPLSKYSANDANSETNKQNNNSTRDSQLPARHEDRLLAAFRQPSISGLDGYSLEHFPTAGCPGSGTVIVKVTVSNSGHVKKASIVGGSNKNSKAREICLGLAKQARFRVPRNQSIERIGTITYTVK